MRKIHTLIICLTLTGIINAQQPGDIVAAASANYLAGLNHTNPGIVESTIFNVMLLKHYYPGSEFTKISKKLDDLAINGDIETIRLKAFIATNYIKNPENYNWIEQGAFANALALSDFSLQEHQQELYEIKNSGKVTEKIQH